MPTRASLAAVVVLVGCAGGERGDACHRDADCGDELMCARDGMCELASQVREVLVTWTVRGQSANEATCARTPELEITYLGDYGAKLTFAPVSCEIGRFLVDKLPEHYVLAVLAVRDGDSETRSIPASNAVAFVLD